MAANARDWKGLCLFALLVPFSGFYFIPRAPLTFLRVIRAFRATAAWGRDFIAFGPLDFGFRPWYAKLARDIRASGRFGIVWDDGYGQPLGTRFYNNFVTYRLYEWLGVRRYALASVVLYLASVAAIVTSIGGDWRLAAVVALLIAASPLFLASQLH
ncbi:MAG TPA: hypothetical protein VMU84_21115, partial [Thermoanaerobaculia bacterium]|nr:hypothetical protein [Thermoanaerobaculia bacterium]